MVYSIFCFLDYFENNKEMCDLIYPKSGLRASEEEFLAVALNLNDFHFIECRLIRLPLLRAQRRKREKGKRRESDAGARSRLISYLLFIVTLNGAMICGFVYILFSKRKRRRQRRKFLLLSEFAHIMNNEPDS